LKNTPCLFANSNHRHEAAGESAFAAVAEKEVGAAGGAKAAGEDVLRAQAGGEELRAVGFGKIQVDIARRGLVARGRHAQPLQRIGLIAGARLIEIAGGVSELRGEFGYEVGADLVTAGADGGAESGEEISRLAAKFEAQAADGLFGNAGERALPTGMNGGDGALFGINEKNRDAIGGLHGEKQAGVIRGRGVALAGVGGRGGEEANYVGVNLLERR